MVDTTLEILVAIAGRAGRAVLDLYGRTLAVEYKRPRDPVTEADRRSNALLIAELNRAFPGVPVVAEESAPAAFAGFHAAPRAFFVDPLDGTREFLDRNGEFAVMIGLVEGGTAAAGVIWAPVTETAWFGAPGRGAWKLDARTGRRHALRVSGTEELARARLVASRSHRSLRLERALAALGPREVAAMGSAGLKGAQVAEGLADAYVDVGVGTKRWDACAVDAVVTAAGGRVSDTRGRPIDYRAPTLANEHGLIVSNGVTHAAVLARLSALAD